MQITTRMVTLPRLCSSFPAADNTFNDTSIMITVVGVDPGLAATGIGLVWGSGLQVGGYSYGAIKTSQNLPLPERLDHIFIKFTEVLFSRKPDLIVVEDIFSLESYPQSGINLGKVCGVILLAGVRASIPMIEMPVRQAKQILTGNGKAPKSQLEQAVRCALEAPAPIRPYHASDALGMALIGLYRYHHIARLNPHVA
jgi:crossover junction endodeoxyribonuclease RuvC